MKYLIGLVAFLLIATPVSAAQFEKNIKFGSKGSEVTKLQEFLTEQGLYTYGITGNFFSLTLKAVKAFQVREGVPATGFVGALTRAKINSILDEQLAGQESEPEAVETKVEVPFTTSDVVKAIEVQTKAIKEQNELLRVQTTTVVYVPQQLETPIAQAVQAPLTAPKKIWNENNWDWSRTTGEKYQGKRMELYFYKFSPNTTITVTIGTSTKSQVGSPKTIFYYNENDNIWDTPLDQTYTLSGEEEGTVTIKDVVRSSGR